MENFYGVDETPEEQALGDAASFSGFVAAHQKEQEKDEVSRSLSKSKQEVETEEIDAGEDDDESDEEPKMLKKRRNLLQSILPNVHWPKLICSFLHQIKLCMELVWMAS